MPWLWTMWMGCSPVAPEYVEQVPIVLEAGRTRTLAVDAVLELPGSRAATAGRSRSTCARSRTARSPA